MMPPDTPPPRPPPPAELIEAAAAAWLSLRDRGMSSAETAAFLRWLEQDPRHAETFRELDRTWADFDRLAAAPAPAAAPPDADLLAPRPRVRRHRPLAWVALSAAAAALVLLTVVLSGRAPRQTAETEVGAFRKLDLPDGSIAQLNTDSALEVRFTPAERQVRITRGEIFFTVAKDPARPFVVAAGPVVVRAIGTAFNVRQHADAVEVLVTEGSVRVDAARRARSSPPASVSAAGLPVLAAGERALVPLRPGAAAPAAPTVERVTPLAVRRALAWQERRLEFDAAPLAEVVREFNRYNRRQLVIAEAELGGRRFSGVFRADGYDTLVRLLETDFGVTATPRGHEILLTGGR